MEVFKAYINKCSVGYELLPASQPVETVFAVVDRLPTLFDKVAKLLGLPYPGGPRVSAEAMAGNSAAIKFPRAWLGRSRHHTYLALQAVRT